MQSELMLVIASLVGGVAATLAHRRIPHLIQREGLTLTRRSWSLTIGAIAAAVVALAFTAFSSFWVGAAYAFLAVMSVLLADVDLRCKLLPNPLLTVTGIGGTALFGAAALFDHATLRLLIGVISAAVLFVVFLLLVTISPSGIGMGDVKLAAIIGLALGFWSPFAVLLGMLIAFILSGVVAAALLLTRRAGRRSMLPFGPFMLAGAALALVPALHAVT